MTDSARASAPKVLISDKMNPLAEEIFRRKGVVVDVRTGLSESELIACIGDYDGLALRSSSQITAPVIAAGAGRLKVIGRAGIGVDNVDVPAATQAGIIVMNTPFGNSITTAEHAIAMMFALARDIPRANASTQAGKWEKSAFMGVELTGKTLGVIGCGNIGAIVASRALGLKMDVIAYDPFLSEERAVEIGVRKVDLDTLLGESDIITLHVPKNDKTKHMIDSAALAKMKDGVRIINCARGGLIVEPDLRAALDSGKVAGAALDVFELEPAAENVLFGHKNVICTPHLGASTTEAQVNVALQVAEQMADFLTTGAVTNALNMPSISAEDAPRLKPYMRLAEQLGSLAGQVTRSAIRTVDISYEGQVSEINTRPLSQVLLASLLKPLLESVNVVNAPQIARARGISVSESRCADCTDFHTAIRLKIETEQGVRTVAGTLFAGQEPRIVMVEGVPIEAALTPHMLFIRNEDRPGLIGGVGTILGDAGYNIADFRLGRLAPEESAVCLISLDSPIPEDIYQKIAALPQVKHLGRLSFPSAGAMS